MSFESPRNVFIAVGSSAIIGMTHLLHRLKVDGIYDQKRDDLFIGMDSDANRLQTLKRFDMDSNPVRIHTIQLIMPSYSEEKQVVKNFAPDWQTMGGITASGVGGDRRLSFTTLNWTSFWDDIGLDELLNKGDRVILLGSAFGGTSTGIFWNISEFIQMRIRSKVESLPERTPGLIQFFGMLLLPEKNAQNSATYPLYRNLCAFFQDMQVIEWRQTLEQKLSVKRGFVSPVYSGWDKKSDKLPVFITDKYRCAEASNLPMEMLFILPTPDNAQGQTKLYFTELAFTLFYLNLSSKIVSTTIDSFKQKIDPDDLCFGGFNMIVARSASNSVLKSRFYELFSQAWEFFWKGDISSDDDSVKSVIEVIENLKIQNDDQTNLEKAKDNIESKIDQGNIDSLSKDFLNDLEEFGNTTCDTTPYTWLSIEGLIKEIYLADDDKFKTIPLAAIIKAYKSEFEKMHLYAENKDSILSDIDSKIKKAKKIQRKRANSKIAKFVNGQQAAKDEVEKKFKTFIKNALEEFIDSYRAAATIPLMPQPIEVEELRALPHFAQNAAKIQNLINESRIQQKSNLKGFVFEDIDPNLKLNVEASGINFNKMCFEAILAEDESSLNAVIKQYESSGVDVLRSAANDLKENNPLKKLHTRIPATELTGYSKDIFKVDHPGKGHLHFCYSCGQAENIDWPTWSELSNGLGFSSFAHFPGAGADNSKAILDGNLSGPGDNSWFHDNHVSGFFKNMQGVWLGTLDLNRKMVDILNSAFRGAPVEEWENHSWEAEVIHGASRPRLQTLRDMVYLGVVLGAIEKKVIDVTNLTDISFNHTKVNLNMISKSGEKIISCSNAYPADLGFSIKLKLIDVKLDWIKNLMKWFNDKENGFVKDFDLGLDSIEGKLLFEKQCINKLKLHVPVDFLESIEQLYDKVYEFIEVSKA